MNVATETTKAEHRLWNAVESALHSLPRPAASDNIHELRQSVVVDGLRHST